MFYEMTERDARLLGELSELTALCNIAWRHKRVYFAKFYNGRFAAVFWKPWAAMDKERTYVVPIDTVANEENLCDAIDLIRAELEAAG